MGGYHMNALYLYLAAAGGAALGVVVMALAFVAGREDERMGGRKK